MRTFARCLSCLCLAALFAGPLLAEDKKPDVKKEEPKKPDVKKEEPKKDEPKKPEVKKEEPKKPDPYAALFAFPKQIKADEKQAAALDELKKDFLPKLEDLSKQEAAIVTPERAKARTEARKKAQADGKKGAELNKIGHEAMKLTADEAKELDRLVKAGTKLRGQINKKKTDLMTEEQKKLTQPKPKADK